MTTETPLPDIKSEVDGIKRRPTLLFGQQQAAQPPDPEPPAPPMTLPDLLNLLIDRVVSFEERMTTRLARIEHVLGIKE